MNEDSILCIELRARGAILVAVGLKALGPAFLESAVSVSQQPSGASFRPPMRVARFASGCRQTVAAQQHPSENVKNMQHAMKVIRTRERLAACVSDNDTGSCGLPISIFMPQECADSSQAPGTNLLLQQRLSSSMPERQFKAAVLGVDFISAVYGTGSMLRREVAPFLSSLVQESYIDLLFPLMSVWACTAFLFWKMLNDSKDTCLYGWDSPAQARSTFVKTLMQDEQLLAHVSKKLCRSNKGRGVFVATAELLCGVIQKTTHGSRVAYSRAGLQALVAVFMTFKYAPGLHDIAQCKNTPWAQVTPAFCALAQCMQIAGGPEHEVEVWQSYADWVKRYQRFCLGNKAGDRCPLMCADTVTLMVQEVVQAISANASDIPAGEGMSNEQSEQSPPDLHTGSAENKKRAMKRGMQQLSVKQAIHRRVQPAGRGQTKNVCMKNAIVNNCMSMFPMPSGALTVAGSECEVSVAADRPQTASLPVEGGGYSSVNRGCSSQFQTAMSVEDGGYSSVDVTSSSQFLSLCERVDVLDGIAHCSFSMAHLGIQANLSLQMPMTTGRCRDQVADCVRKELEHLLMKVL